MEHRTRSTSKIWFSPSLFVSRKPLGSRRSGVRLFLRLLSTPKPPPHSCQPNYSARGDIYSCFMCTYMPVLPYCVLLLSSGPYTDTDIDIDTSFVSPLSLYFLWSIDSASPHYPASLRPSLCLGLRSGRYDGTSPNMCIVFIYFPPFPVTCRKVRGMTFFIARVSNIHTLGLFSSLPSSVVNTLFQTFMILMCVTARPLCSSPHVLIA